MSFETYADQAERQRLFTRRFAKGSPTFWEIVADIILKTGCSKDDAERFVSAQEACIKTG